MRKKRGQPGGAAAQIRHAVSVNKLIMGTSNYASHLKSLHPSTAHAFQLWQLFLDNVNPLSKVVHVPTLQAQLVRTTADLPGVPANIEALLFAIYTTAVSSLKSEQCPPAFGESKTVLVAKYMAATHQALANVAFLESTDLVVLQALVILLVGSLRSWPYRANSAHRSQCVRLMRLTSCGSSLEQLCASPSA